jgi:(p)ppGpp synthase/HD superfamily hydrolase
MKPGLVERAARFAAAAHAGQTRKWTGVPYFTHVAGVAERLAGDGSAVRAAAYLHDTLEDTAATYEQLVAEFGAEVADLVVELTDIYTKESYPHLNRKARKALECARLATISGRAKRIKLADIADNAADIEAVAPKRFAQMWLAEKAALLKVLT